MTLFQKIGIICFIVAFVSCGKVVQDITKQSPQSVFKTAKFTVDLSHDFPGEWHNLVTTGNTSTVYSYYQGIKFGTGLEKLAWASAEVNNEIVSSSNVVKVTNFDIKKNTVTSARYQQGLLKVSKTVSQNYEVTSEFRKIRPKYNYYSSIHYLSKDNYIMVVSEDIPSESVSVTPYTHLISSLFMKHLEKESYDPGGVMPLTLFKQIIPTAAATTMAKQQIVSNDVVISVNVVVVIPTQDLYPVNNIRSFDVNSPVFSIKSSFSESLLGTLSLVKYSDEMDVLDYISAQESDVFSDYFKELLISSIKKYYDSIPTNSNEVIPTGNSANNQQNVNGGIN